MEIIKLTLYLGLINFAMEVHRTQENTYLTFTSLLENTVKDTDEQTDEEIHKVTSKRILSSGVPVPLELGYIILPVWMCSQT